MTRRAALSPEEAKRGLYFDLEGTQNDPPSFGGVLWWEPEQEWFEQTVFEEGLASAAVTKGLERTALITFYQRLLRRSQAESRRLIGWSSHELTVAESVLPSAEFQAFRSRYLDAKQIARRWLRRTQPDVVLPRTARRGRHTLEAYMPLVGYVVPQHLRSGNSAQRIRDVRQQLVRHGSYGAIRPIAKAKWTKALEHNYHDCAGMRAVTLAVSGPGSV